MTGVFPEAVKTGRRPKRVDAVAGFCYSLNLNRFARAAILIIGIRRLKYSQFSCLLSPFLLFTFSLVIFLQQRTPNVDPLSIKVRIKIRALCATMAS